MSEYSEHKTSFTNDQLSNQTSIFGLRLCVVLGVGVGAAIVIFLFLVSLWLTSKRNNNNAHKSNNTNNNNNNSHQPTIPNHSRDIQEIRIDGDSTGNQARILPDPCPESDPFFGIGRQSLVLKTEEETPNTGYNRIHIEIGKDHRIVYPEKYGGSSSHGSASASAGETRSGEQVAMVVPEVSHLGWGHWYTLRDLEAATNGFADENVVGEGGYGIVYHGVLPDNTHVAVKNLLNNRGQAEKEFEVEVEAIGRVRHKNLVRLIGYCAEGAHRMLVYEYVDNGNLEQWLHGELGPRSPLTWDTRMQIIQGTAKGLTYLHEGLEPKVIHRDIKSSNILLDKQWNPKVSDFGLAKLLGSESSYITTRVMGTFGYVAPEYASTGMLNETSDVYSFGILIMEIISGRNPVDYSKPSEEVNLVDWLKRMVADRNPEGILDPNLPQKPSVRALKRVLLVALRCVDPNAQKRPKVGHVIHMLEAEDSSFREDRRSGRDPGLGHHAHHAGSNDVSADKKVKELDAINEHKSGSLLTRQSEDIENSQEEK